MLPIQLQVCVIFVWPQFSKCCLSSFSGISLSLDKESSMLGNIFGSEFIRISWLGRRPGNDCCRENFGPESRFSFAGKLRVEVRILSLLFCSKSDKRSSRSSSPSSSLMPFGQNVRKLKCSKIFRGSLNDRKSWRVVISIFSRKMVLTQILSFVRWWSRRFKKWTWGRNSVLR